MKITLLDGRTIIKDFIEFDGVSHRFTYFGEDLTALITRADKLTFRGFDVEKDNRRLSNEKRTGAVHSNVPDSLNESTGSHLLQQLSTDPLGAPLDTLDNTAKKILGSFGVKIVLVLVGIGVFIWAGGLALIKGKLAK